MNSEVREIRIFVSSPGDRTNERNIVKRAVGRLNSLRSLRGRVSLRALLYEENTPALAGRSPQEVVDSYTVRPDEADIIVCVIGTRLGTPWRDAEEREHESGTVYEFETAYDAWSRVGSPLILLYRSAEPVDATEIDPHDLERVNAFFARFDPDDDEFKGMLVRYRSAEEFEGLVFRDLEAIVQEHFLDRADELQGRGPRATRHKPVGAPMMAPPLPRNFVDRPEISGPLIAALLDEASSTAIALEGGGGFGKTTLASWACRNGLVTERYRDGVLWVTLGESVQDSHLTAKCRDLCQLISAEKAPRFETPDVAGAYLGQIIGDQQILLVVDDVWEAQHLSVFLHGGPNCRRLVTTQNRRLTSGMIDVFSVNQMTPAEASELISSGLDIGGDDTERLIDSLVDAIGSWPLMATQLNDLLRQDLAAGRPLADIVADIHEVRRERGVSALDLALETDRKKAASTTLETSLRALARHTEDASLTERFLDLAIFPGNALVPISIVAHWWRKTQLETRLLVRSLADFSLVNFDAASGVLSLHDVIREFVRKRLSDDDVTLRHASLVDSWRSEDGSLGKLPDESGFAWFWLAYHLEQAGRLEELLDALKNPDFLAGQAFLVSPAAVVSDFERVAGMDDQVDELARQFRLIGHVLTDLPSREAATATLAARMTGLVAQSVPTPRLVPVGDLPDRPHPALDELLLSANLASPALSWQNGRLAFCVSESVFVLDMEHREMMDGIAFEGSQVVDVELDAQGARLAVVVAEAGVEIGQDHPVGFRVFTGEGMIFDQEIRGYVGTQWSPSGEHVAVTAESARVYETAGWEMVLDVEADEATWLDDRVLIVATGPVVAALDIETGDELRSVDVGWDVSRIRCSADVVLLIGDRDGVEVRESSDLSLRGVLGEQPVFDADPSPIAPLIASCSYESHLGLWDLDQMSLVSMVDTHSDVVIFWSPDGHQIASFGPYGIRLWSVERLEQCSTEIPWPVRCVSLCHRPATSTFAVAHGDDVSEWSMDWEHLRTVPTRSVDLVSSPDGRWLASAAAESIELLDVDLQPVAAYEIKGDAGYSISWSEDSALRIAGADRSGGLVLAVLAPDGPRVVQKFEDVGVLIESVAWSEHRSFAALRVANDAEPSAEDHDLDESFDAVIFSASGSTWATTEIRGVDAVAWRADGSLLTAEEGAIVSRRAGDLGEVARFEFELPVLGITPSKGELIAITDIEGRVTIVDGTGHAITSFWGGLAYPIWSEDSEWVAYAPGQFAVCAVHVPSGRTLGFGIDDEIHSLAWHPDRRELAVGGRAGLYRFAIEL